MNHQLLNNRPENLDKSEFYKIWNNNTICWDALRLTLEQWLSANEEVKKEDFDCPNHYAKLAFQAGKAEVYKQILSLLPKE